jgi:hypothetical protein
MATPLQSRTAEGRGAVLLAWAFSALIALEWLLVYALSTPSRLVVWVGLAAVIDIGLYWLVAHYIFENHEIEFSIGCILMPILVGMLLPVFLQAQHLAKLRQQKERQRIESKRRSDRSNSAIQPKPLQRDAIGP